MSLHMRMRSQPNKEHECHMDRMLGTSVWLLVLADATKFGCGQLVLLALWMCCNGKQALLQFQLQTSWQLQLLAFMTLQQH